jgi:RNA polymerase sigma-70 factor (ECF subfamily)
MGPLMPSATIRREQLSSLDAVFEDDALFRAWYEAALPRVYQYLYHRCGRRHETAEELTQQTFVEAVASRSRFDGGDATGWLIGIARHRLIDHFRRVERRERGLARFLAARGPQIVWIGEIGADDRLARALTQLPGSQRAAIVLRYFDDLPVREVARLLERSEASVESLLSRGRESLRRTYGELGDG